MADQKISALTAATTPLAGTEVLPIVQSGATVKVATDNLTVKNVRSNATTGILQIAGPSASSTRTMTTPDANFTAARTDAAQSFTGDQTLATGNLVQGTAAKGFNFSANTPNAGNTSTLLNWYEEGACSMTISAAVGTIVSSSVSAFYTRIGRLVSITGTLTVSDNGTGSSSLSVAGLPFTPNGNACGIGRENVNNGKSSAFVVSSNSTSMNVITYDNQYPVASGSTISFSVTYTV